MARSPTKAGDIDATSQVEEEPSAASVAARELVQGEEATPPPARADEQVQPATAEVPAAQRVGAPDISPEEFATLVDQAAAAVPALLSGNLRSQVAKKNIGQAYMSLCRLAGEFAFVGQAADLPEAQEKIAQARSLFRQVVAEAPNRDDLAVICKLWWDHPGRSNQGIFLVGQIRGMQNLNGGILCRVMLEGARRAPPIPVLVNRSDLSVGDRVGIVGSIVGEPRTAIPEYPADDGQVVIAHDSFSAPPMTPSP